MKTILLTLFVSAIGACFAQTSWTSEPTDHVFKSTIFDAERTISIYLPEAYFSEDEPSLPVAFVFDGQFGPYLQMTAGTMEYYYQSEEGPVFILVAIHSPDRWFDFTMPNREGVTTKVEGGSDILTRHIREEVLPYIQTNYRTTPFCLGIAHSLGGTYVINEFFSENSLFNAIIAASPNTVYEDGLPVERMKQYLEKTNEKYGFVYTGVGDIDGIEDWFGGGLSRMDSIVGQSNTKGLLWNSVRVENEGHMSSFLRILDDGLHKLNEVMVLTDDDVKPILTASDQELPDVIGAILDEKEKFTLEKVERNGESFKMMVNALKKMDEYDQAIRVLELQKTAFEEEKNRQELKKVETRIKYCLFYKWTVPAKKAFDEENYVEAARLYREAMKLEVLNGTHVERLPAALAFAQTGNSDEAFEQLELLESHFGWMGRKGFDNDKLFDPLKTDERWEPLMERFAKNYLKEFENEEE